MSQLLVEDRPGGGGDRLYGPGVPNHHYRFDVTPGSGGVGTLVVSFGHDELADETSFPAATVTVHPAP